MRAREDAGKRRVEGRRPGPRDEEALAFGNRSVGPRRPIVHAREAVGVAAAEDRGRKPGVEPASGLEHIFGVDREALDELLAGGIRGALEGGELRPGRFRVDVIGGHRRDPAPIVDAGADEPCEGCGAQIGRGLNIHGGTQDEPRHGDRAQVFRLGGIRRVRHARSSLGAEVLDDDLLQVTVALVQLAEREECLDALAPRLADADEEARGEGDRGLAREADGLEPEGRVLVRRAEVRAAALGEPLRTRLQHQALRHRDGAECCDVRCGEQARIGVGQKPGLG